MVIILIHWLIKDEYQDKFKTKWESMSVEKGLGLYREILTTVENGIEDPKFKTFTLASPNYVTYVNIAMWESLEKFDEAIKNYFPKATIEEKGDKTIHTIELEDFEFKLRERVVLKKIKDRGIQLPDADLEE